MCFYTVAAWWPECRRLRLDLSSSRRELESLIWVPSSAFRWGLKEKLTFKSMKESSMPSSSRQLEGDEPPIG